MTADTVEHCGGAAVPTSGVHPIHVKISPVIDREFRRRDVFPELRLESAAQIVNGATGVHKLTVGAAQALLRDAKAYQMCDLPRGVPVAYSALARNLEFSLRQEARRGLWDDPGRTEVAARQFSHLASLNVGQAVQCCHSADDSGETMTVTAGYDPVACVRNSETGHYISDDGARLDYAPSYRVKDHAGKEFFARPWMLLTKGYGITHLRLVAVNGVLVSMGDKQ